MRYSFGLSGTRRKQLCKAYSRLLIDWEWEWYGTLTFSSRFNHKNSNFIKGTFLKWIRDLCTSEGIQFGSWFIIAYQYGHPHIHFCAIGLGRRDGRIISLIDIDPEPWKNKWALLVRERGRPISPVSAKIEIPNSIEDVSHYLASNYLWFKSTWAVMDSYNQKLLVRHRQFRGL